MKAKVWKYSGDLDRQNRIADLVIRYAVHPEIRKFAINLVKSCPDYDDICELQKIFKFVRDNIRYRSDVAYIDSYHSPLKILELKAADCDDFTILTDALLMSLGWKVGSKIVAKRPDLPFHHIYPIVLFPKGCSFQLKKLRGKYVAIIPPKCKIIPLDPSVKSLECCQEIAHAKEKIFLYLPQNLLQVADTK